MGLIPLITNLDCSVSLGVEGEEDGFGDGADGESDGLGDKVGNDAGDTDAIGLGDDKG